MNTPSLRPPLPPSLSHTGIRFLFDRQAHPHSLTPETIAAIATALSAMLPAGDLLVDTDGIMRVMGTPRDADTRPSLWYQVGLVAGIERSSL